jgi:hypothetical protein
MNKQKTNGEVFLDASPKARELSNTALFFKKQKAV